MPSSWTSADIGDLTGQIVLITGANSGLGLESAKALATHGAKVIMAGRDPGRLAAAAAQVHGDVVTLDLDLADLASVERAAVQLISTLDRIDVLINNAGIMAPPLRYTADGFESQIGTNHLGHFALTGRLLPLLRAGRVVTVSSLAHTMGRIDLDDLNYRRRSYSPWPAYGASKVANLMFTAELDRRATASGWDLIAAAAHPGYAATNLQIKGPGYAQNPVGRLLGRAGNLVFGQSAAAGAWPQLYAAVGSDVAGNDYFGPASWRQARGHPKRVGRSATAMDQELAVRLWQASEDLTGVVYRWG